MKNPIFAIGDVHGCYDELKQLMTILEGLEKNYDDRPTYLFLGDYVDRGPKSMNVVEYLRHLQTEWPGRVICLKGNHDDMMTWGECHEYIEETLTSYGVNDATMIRSDHIEWVKKLPYAYQDHMGRVFVHAAIDRSLALNEQTELTMLWGRDPYLSDRSMDGGYVVHGHSVVRSNLPEVYHNRCAVDTGCCFGRVLSAAIFDDRRVAPTMLVNHRGLVRDIYHEAHSATNCS